ncbi:hypothetical protein GCM10018775_92830 [Streptomyces umbrinus]|nr:hypothetical protein GCM10018775_92830 [Streptomyces umbrinus]
MPERIMDALRRHATARDWDVHTELHDATPLTHRALRSGWQKVIRLLDEGAVEGIVAPYEQQISADPQGRTQLRTWLLARGVFAVYVMPQDHPTNLAAICDAAEHPAARPHPDVVR